MNKGNFWGRSIAQKLADDSSYVTESGCLIWLAAVNEKGYGVVRRDGKNVYAHRASWELHRGPLAAGACVLHRCDVPCCINVNHLFIGTIADNNKDMADKGRSHKPKGEASKLHKLTNAQVIEIRTLAGTHRAIGARFGVGHSTIGYIKRGETWAHL